MFRTRLLFLPALGIAWASLGAASARASHADYLLHVQGRTSATGRGLDFAVAWNPGHGGSPFDFTTDISCDRSFPRLRAAWQVLRGLPEGHRVTIDTDSETIEAWRRNGYLVLAPRDDGERGRSRIRIPDYIVTTLIARDGRLSRRDIDQLAREHGSVTLVKIDSPECDLDVWVGPEAED